MNTLSGSVVTAWERVRERSERGCGSCFALLHTSQKTLAQQLYSFRRPDSSLESGRLAHTPPYTARISNQRCAGGGEIFVGRLLIPKMIGATLAVTHLSSRGSLRPWRSLSSYQPTSLFKLKDPLPSASSGDFAPFIPLLLFATLQGSTTNAALKGVVKITLSGNEVTAWERVRERSERGCGSFLCFPPGLMPAHCRVQHRILFEHDDPADG